MNMHNHQMFLFYLVHFFFSDLERIREGIGSKFSMVTQYLSTFFSGIAVGIYANWRLTYGILCIGPLLIGTSAYLAKVGVRKCKCLICLI